METAGSGNRQGRRTCRRDTIQAALSPIEHIRQGAEGARLETQRHEFQCQMHLVATLTDSHMANLAADQQLATTILMIHERSL
jgi:hypothetical protein